MKTRPGFTLIEVLFSAGIMAVVLCGLLASYAQTFMLTDLTREISLATNGIRDKLELIKSENYIQLSQRALQPAELFSLAGFAPSDSCGFIAVTDLGGGLVRIRIVASFRSKSQRIIGEDRNLNGQWDTGEDSMPQGRIGQLDSPIEIATLVSQYGA
jgi:prepilin-type N-terminal cleavage/methylation domain-containing protein